MPNRYLGQPDRSGQPGNRPQPGGRRDFPPDFGPEAGPPGRRNAGPRRRPDRPGDAHRRRARGPRGRDERGRRSRQEAFDYDDAQLTRRHRRRVAFGILTLVILLGAAGFALVKVAGRGLGSNNGPLADASVNQPVADGVFEFTVTGFECGIDRVGTAAIAMAAQGQYCQVRLIVKNLSTEPQPFFDGEQYALDSAGQRYQADTAAGLYIEDRDKGWLVDDVKPGTRVRGGVLFDIPTEATIAMVELHESPTSPGVTVDLNSTASPTTVPASPSSPAASS